MSNRNSYFFCHHYHAVQFHKDNNFQQKRWLSIQKNRLAFFIFLVSPCILWHWCTKYDVLSIQTGTVEDRGLGNSDFLSSLEWINAFWVDSLVLHEPCTGHSTNVCISLVNSAISYMMNLFAKIWSSDRNIHGYKMCVNNLFRSFASKFVQICKSAGVVNAYTCC